MKTPTRGSARLGVNPEFSAGNSTSECRWRTVTALGDGAVSATSRPVSPSAVKVRSASTSVFFGNPFVRPASRALRASSSR